MYLYIYLQIYVYIHAYMYSQCTSPDALTIHDLIAIRHTCSVSGYYTFQQHIYNKVGGCSTFQQNIL